MMANTNKWGFIWCYYNMHTEVGSNEPFIHTFISVCQSAVYVPFCCPGGPAREVERAGRWRGQWRVEVEGTGRWLERWRGQLVLVAETGRPPEGPAQSASSHGYRRPEAPGPPGRWPDPESTSHRCAECDRLFSASRPGSDREEGYHLLLNVLTHLCTFYNLCIIQKCIFYVVCIFSYTSGTIIQVIFTGPPKSKM